MHLQSEKYGSLICIEIVTVSAGLSMAAVPGSLMSPPRVSLQMAPPAIHSVLLVSNLNPEVRGHTQKPGVKLTLLTTFVSTERLASLPLHLIW